MNGVNASRRASANGEILKATYDVIVVGSDPAGYACSRTLSQEGMRVLQLESPAQSSLCPEWVLSDYFEIILNFLDSVSLPNFTVQDTSHVYAHRDHEKTTKAYRLSGRVYQRQALNHALSLHAKASGVELVPGVHFRSFSEKGVEVEHLGKTIKIPCKAVVAADGVRSLVRLARGWENPDYFATLQYRVHLKEKHHHVHFYHFADLTQGLGWFIPRGTMANVGFGVSKPIAHVLMFKLHQILDRLIAHQWIEPDELAEKSGGLIPVGGNSLSFGDDGIFFVGDSAGLADPILPGIQLGLGIGFSAAILAGQFIASEIRSGKRPRMQGYLQSLRPLLEKGIAGEVRKTSVKPTLPFAPTR